MPKLRSERRRYRFPSALFLLVFTAKLRFREISPAVRDASLGLDQRGIRLIISRQTTYQVPVSEVERQTGLEFGKKFRDTHPLNKVEARPIRELIPLKSIVT
jgi:hypothetical protein